MRRDRLPRRLRRDRDRARFVPIRLGLGTNSGLVLKRDSNAFVLLASAGWSAAAGYRMNRFQSDGRRGLSR